MMRSLNGIHKPHIIQIRMHFEKILPQVLRSFKILQVSCDILTRDKLLALGGVAVISKNDDLVNFEDARNSCDFADEVGSYG